MRAVDTLFMLYAFTLAVTALGTSMPPGKFILFIPFELSSEEGKEGIVVSLPIGLKLSNEAAVSLPIELENGERWLLPLYDDLENGETASLLKRKLENGERVSLPLKLENGERVSLPLKLENGEIVSLPLKLENGERVSLPLKLENGEIVFLLFGLSFLNKVTAFLQSEDYNNNHLFDPDDIKSISAMIHFNKNRNEPLDIENLKKHPLSEIGDEETFELLMEFWCSDAPRDMDNIDSAQLSDLVKASDYLRVCGQTSQHFTKNMMKVALLDKRPSDVFKVFPYAYQEQRRRISWQMLVAFAAETGMEVRVSGTGDVTICSAGDAKADTYGKQESDCKMTPAIKRLSLRCGAIGRAVGTSGRMAIFAWFLYHLEIPSLFIGAEFKLASDDIGSFINAVRNIRHLKMEKEIPSRLVLEQLDLSECPLHLNCIRRLALILPFPSIKELRINCSIEYCIEDTGIFRRCNGLEKLYLYGSKQSSQFISKLIPYIPSIKELCVEVKEGQLSENAFERCKKLEKLTIQGYPQSNLLVSRLMLSIPSIKELWVDVVDGRLNGDIFEECKKLSLEKLYLYGDWQSGSFFSKLAPCIPSIKELDICVQNLDSEAASVFDQFKELEKLHLYGSNQEASFVSELVLKIPSIKDLYICVQNLDSEAASAFKGCMKLESLTIRGCLKSGFIEHILNPSLINSLKTLEVHKSQASQGLSNEDNQAIEAAEKRSVKISIKDE